jgi:hypothetical protein
MYGMIDLLHLSSMFGFFCTSRKILTLNLLHFTILYHAEPFLGNNRKKTGSCSNSPCATVEVPLEMGFSVVARAEGL